MDNFLAKAVDKLAADFNNINWRYLDVPSGSPREKTQLWPYAPSDDVAICVYKGHEIRELFHRQDFFFFNFAYKGDYSALSYAFNNRITVREGECYIGQPYAGYAINDKSENETVIVGVLIQTEAFFKTYFHVLSTDEKLFRFFLNPQINEYSDEYILLKFDDEFSVRRLLELMIIEYADSRENTQEVLKPLTLALMMLVARQFKKGTDEHREQTLAEKIVGYIGSHIDTATLQSAAEHFSYHPNYISTLLPKELGKTFSQILTEERMKRAVALLRGTNLPVSEIAALLGYSNSSNFYTAFRKFYGASPREYVGE